MKAFITASLLLIAGISVSQTPRTSYGFTTEDPAWIALMYSTNPNLLSLQQAYESYYSVHEFTKNRHTQYYKRLMREYLPLIDVDGYIETPVSSQSERDYLERYSLVQEQREDGIWEELGPWHFDPEVAFEFNVQSPGACHVYTVEQSAENPDIVYCGTATAGLWKSVDKGLHWELMTRDLLVQGVYSIAIHPDDANHVYFGESNGTLWESTDGGDSWSEMSNDGWQDNDFWCRDLKLKPDNPDVIFAATNDALYRSDNAGASWTEVFSGEYMELEFHPTDPNTVYTVKLIGNNTIFQKSTDGGINFSAGGVGWPTPGTSEEQKRCEMAVSIAEPDNIYVLASGSADGGNGLFGIYLSEDAGENWTFQCCGSGPGGIPAVETNPNILGWSEGGEGDGGQYYYDLALDVSPTNPDLLFGAGINVWRSENTGSSWSLNAHWVTWVGENTIDRYTHADVHDVKFFEHENGVDMWVASDGGLFYSADQGDNLEPRMYGLHGTDFWGWQAGAKHGEVMVGGTYHNGTLIRNNDVYFWGLDDEESGGWLAELAGDNFRGFVNPGDPTIGYHDGGAFRYSEDRFTRISGLTFDNSKLPNTAYWWGEYGNMEWDPRCYNNIYSPVGSDLWFSENGGATWELLHSFGGEKIVTVKVCPRDANRIYVTHKNNGSDWRIWTTADGGDNWDDVTPPSNVVGNNNNRPKAVEIDTNDPLKAWMLIMGNHTGNKIFKTTDGGDSWEDMTFESLETEYCISLLHQRGTDGGLYVGTNRTVYYINDTMGDWELWANGLPAQIPGTFMLANYCQAKVRTAGSRGVHQCDFYEESSVLAGFTADQLKVNLGVRCDNDTVYFADNSVLRCENAVYAWTFEGAEPSSSEDINPAVVYSEPGTWDVTLTVTDEDGNTDTLTWANMIEVVNEPVGYPIAEDFNNGFPPLYWKIENPDGGGSWEQGQVIGEEGNLVAQFPNYWVDTNGQTDLVVMPAIDLSDEQDPILFFDISYQTYAEYIDGLEVWYRTGDNLDWQVIYSKMGSELAVEGNYTWFWWDEGGELLWRTDTVDLSPLEGESCVQLAFANIGGYGNHIWVDNVNIANDDGTSIIEEYEADILLYPNPASESIYLRFPAHYARVSFALYNAQGALVMNDVLVSSREILLDELSAGIYHASISTPYGAVSKKVIIK